MKLIQQFFGLIAQELNKKDKTRSYRGIHVETALGSLYGENHVINKWPLVLFTQRTTIEKIFCEMRKQREEREKLREEEREKYLKEKEGKEPIGVIPRITL